MLSIEALTKLLDLRETVNDNKVLNQINEILKPVEYTRLDKLIDLLFITSQDNQINIEEVIEEISTNKNENTTERSLPVNYHDECIQVMSKTLNKTFIKQSKSAYLSSDNLTALTCAISKDLFDKAHRIVLVCISPTSKGFSGGI